MGTDDAKKFEIVDENSSDPFSLERLRVPQAFLEQTPVKKLMPRIPIKKPSPQDFIRVHRDPSYRELMAFLKVQDENELFVVDLSCVPELQGECYLATCYVAITRTGNLFLWPVRIPAADGRINDWHLAAARAAEEAMQRWVRLKANMSLRAYDIFVAENKDIPEPEWPELSFAEIVRLALKEHRPINSLDHPIAKRLRGA
jgi:hypothetical protein